MACSELLIELKNIVQALNPLTLLNSIDTNLRRLVGDGQSYQDIWYGWTRVRKNNSVFYTKNVTLTGTTQTEFLALSRVPLQLNRIAMYFNSANARTFNIRVYNTETATYYTTLDSQSGHTSDSRIIQLGVEYKYRPHKLEWNFSVYTASDVVSIEVQVDEL